MIRTKEDGIHHILSLLFVVACLFFVTASLGHQKYDTSVRSKQETVSEIKSHQIREALPESISLPAVPEDVIYCGSNSHPDLFRTVHKIATDDQLSDLHHRVSRMMRLNIIPARNYFFRVHPTAPDKDDVPILG